jgi:hypothetical protein
MQNDVLSTIRERWIRLESEPRAGVSDDDVIAFEKRHSVRLPESVRNFYTFVDGMADYLTDEQLISFWSLARLDSVPALLSDCRGTPGYAGIEKHLPDASSYFVFADWSIWCHMYAMRLTTDPHQPADVIWIGNGNLWYRLANSFNEFLWNYADGSRNILFPSELQ